MDPRLHKKFLDYRERHRYFGQGKAHLTFEEFAQADAEQSALEALGDGRSDDEEARFVELCARLHRD